MPGKGYRLLLAIDTSTKYAGILLYEDETEVFSQLWHSSNSHTVELMPAINNALDKCKIKGQDILGIALALGPGGFSSLRVGISAAKGLSLALKIPLIGISTLEAEAFPYAHTGMPICPILEIGKSNIGWAQFEMHNNIWTKVHEEQIISSSEIIRYIPNGALICGEGLTITQSLTEEIIANKMIKIEPSKPKMRLWALAKLGFSRLQDGQTDDMIKLQPLYLREPSITQPNSPSRIKQ